jgi:hypothetical protein
VEGGYNMRSTLKEEKVFSCKRAVSLVLAVTMASSVLCSCNADSKADEELIDLTEEGIKLVLDRKISKLSKISTSDFADDKSDWAEDLDFTPSGRYTADERAVFEAISDTIDYEIDEDSVESSNKNGEGRICVEFTMADYGSLIGDAEAMNDSGSFTRALGSCGDKDIEVWFDFEKEGDTWLIANTEEILNNLYSFREERFVFVPDLSESSFSTTWYGTDYYNGDCYENAFTINYEIYFYDNSDTSQVYFTVDYNGELLYTSSRGVTDAYYSINDPGAPLDESGTLATGEYTITFYDGNDRLITSGTCMVYNTTPSAADYINWYYDESDWGVYALYDNASTIDPDLNLANLNDYSYTDYYYNVTYNGENVYTGYGYMGYYHASDQDPNSWTLEAGLYQIDFYDYNTDAYVVTAYAIVLRDGVGSDGTYLGAFRGLNVTGRNMSPEMMDDFSAAYWYSSDPASPEEDMIFDSASSLTYRIPVTEDYGTLHYDITYSEDGDEDSAYAYVMNSSETCEVQYGDDGSMYYEIPYEGVVGAGYYRVTVLADGGMDFSLFSVCQVQ